MLNDLESTQSQAYQLLSSLQVKNKKYYMEAHDLFLGT